MSFTYSITLIDPTNVLGASAPLVVANASAALADWSEELTGVLRGGNGLGSIEVELRVEQTSVGRFAAASASNQPLGTIDGRTLLMDGVPYELVTGVDVNGALAADAIVYMSPSYLQNVVWIDPTPTDFSDSVPSDRNDLVSVFRHEFGHALGMNTFRNSATGSLDSSLTVFDALVRFTNGIPYFAGPRALAERSDQEIPITFDTITQNFSHYGNFSGPNDAEIQNGLMNGLQFFTGTRYSIGDLDVGIIGDILSVGMPASPAIVLSIAALSADKAEGNGGGPTPFTFTVTRSGDTSGFTAVKWEATSSDFNGGIVPGAPAAASDFTSGVLPSGIVTFAAGETSKTIVVNIAGDTAYESSGLAESFTLTLFNPTLGTTIATPVASGHIRNDDPAPASDDYAGDSTTTGQVAVGGSVTGNLAISGDADWFRVNLTAGTLYTFSLQGAPSGAGTLADPFIYLYNNAGMELASNDDSSPGALESHLTYTPASSGTYYLAAREFGDNDIGTYRLSVSGSTPAAPTLSIAAASANKSEGTSGGSTPFTFTVTRSGDASGSSSTSYAVTGSGANPASSADFFGGFLPSGIINFAPGEISKTITVNVLADGTVEPTEGFQVTLSSASGASLGTSSAIGSIVNDEVPPPPPNQTTLSIQAATVTEGNAIKSLNFVVALSSPVASAVTVQVTTANGSAIAGSDYSATSGIVTIPAGAISTTFTVPVLGDVLVEGNETFSVMLSSPIGATIANGIATGTILDDDEHAPPPVTGLDIVLGGGADYFIATALDDRIAGGEGPDTVFAGDGRDMVLGGEDRDFLVGDGGNDTGFGGNGDDVLFGGGGADSLVGEDGVDFLFGDAGANTLDGGAGNDRIHIGQDDVFADGSEGIFDVLVILNPVGPPNIDLGATSNQNATGSGAILQGFEAVDASISNVPVHVTGAALNGFGNVLFTSVFDDTVTGSALGDIILGGGGNDILNGGAGDDTIIADAGSDTLTGGGGADLFFCLGDAFAPPIRITDFLPGTDNVALLASLGLTADEAVALMQQSGADAVLGLPGGGVIVLVGVEIGAVTAADLEFV